MSHYLNGRIPIGLEACIKWAALLGCDPAEIRPDYDPLFAAVTRARTGSVYSESPQPAHEPTASRAVDVVLLRTAIAQSMRELAKRRIVPQDGLLAAAAAFLYTEYARRGLAAEAAKSAIDDAIRHATTSANADEPV